MAVLVAEVKEVKMGADTVVMVADLVPALRLKESGCVNCFAVTAVAAVFRSVLLYCCDQECLQP